MTVQTALKSQLFWFLLGEASISCQPLLRLVFRPKMAWSLLDGMGCAHA
jgi:hypothetical protein